MALPPDEPDVAGPLPVHLRFVTSPLQLRAALPSFVASAWHHVDMPRSWHLERYPGKHVAIDMKTDEVVLAADTPQELHEQIQALGVRNVATMRAPTKDEPLFVGRG